MNVLFPEFLRQALAQRAKRKLARREGARGHVTPQACRCACDQQRAPLTLIVQFVRLER